jgi:hypothetical protein
MSRPNIYPVQLLNDLHNYFPDVLYNPGRFRNIQDLLDYIRQVADVNPYTRGLNIYNNQQTYNARTNMGVRQNATHIPTYPPAGPVAQAPPINATWGPAVMATTTTLDENEHQTTRIRVPLNNMNTTALMNTLLGGMFGDILGVQAIGGGGLQDFLNQRVVVHPTNEEIDNASTLYRATARLDDICAICQDMIELNQEVRKLNHCNHCFHSECIDTWFQTNVMCPTCRHDIREVTNTTNNRNNNPPPVPDNYRRMNINENN